MLLIRTMLVTMLLVAAAHAQVQQRPQPHPQPHPQPKVDAWPGDSSVTEDEELSIAALEGLMAHPPDRALPILKKVLAGSQSTVVKRRALFVLSQINSPEARDILMQT